MAEEVRLITCALCTIAVTAPVRESTKCGELGGGISYQVVTNHHHISAAEHDVG